MSQETKVTKLWLTCDPCWLGLFMFQGYYRLETFWWFA